MVKKNKDLSKTERQLFVLSLVEQSGVPLDKQQITEKVAIRFETNKNYISRSIYRDLNELVQLNKISVYYEDKKGNIYYQTDDLKNLKGFWHSPKLDPHSSEVQGVNSLRIFGGDCFTSKLLLQDVRIFEINSLSIDNVGTGIIFPIASKTFVLSFSSEATPISIFVSRSTDLNKFTFKKVEHETKRILYLYLPYKDCSALKNGEPHCKIDYYGSKVEFTDCQSTNGSYLIKLSDYKSFLLPRSVTREIINRECQAIKIDQKLKFEKSSLVRLGEEGFLYVSF